jgi:hypothetical protein
LSNPPEGHILGREDRFPPRRLRPSRVDLSRTNAVARVAAFGGIPAGAKLTARCRKLPETVEKRVI